MEEIGEKIIELKQSVEEPDSNASNPHKKKNVQTKEAAQGNHASPEDLVSFLAQVQSWIAKRGTQFVKQKLKDQSDAKTEKDDENWIAVRAWIEHIQQTITTPRQDPFVFHETSVPCANLMEEIEFNLKSKIQKLEQQYTELTSDVQICLEKLKDSSDVADTKGREKETPNRQEDKGPDSKELKVRIDNYKKECKRVQQQYTELTSDVDECSKMLNNFSDVSDDKNRKHETKQQQENKDPDTKKLKVRMGDFKKEYKRLEESEKALQLEIKKLVNDVKSHKVQLEKLEQSQSEETASQTQKQSEEFSSALERIQAVCTEGIQAQPSERNDSQAVKYRNLQTLANDTVAVVSTKLKEFEKSNKALESNIKNTIEENEQLKEQADRFKTKLDEANTETDNYSEALQLICSMCHNHLQAENTTIYGKEKKKNQLGHENKGQITEQTVQLVTEIMERQVKIREENVNLRREIGEMQKKYEADRSRLSKYMGADLRAGNPNIADLSDSNRPTKIAEAFSELYDNIWTDAFVELNKRKKVTETNTIENLLDILQFAFEYCTEAATKQLPELEYYMRSPAIDVSEKARKESKKEKEKVDPVTLQALHDFRKKTWTVASANLIKHYVNVMKSKEKWKDGYSSKECSLYISTCIQLCWQMVIQDPPVLIQFEKKGKKIKFDKEKYRAYMQSGEQVDFIVWPPIYLHQGGPLLNKGVAEGQK